MPISYDITQDLRYKQGEKAGEARGMERGIERGIERGMELGMERGMELHIIQLLQSDLYREGVIDMEQIASLSRTTRDKVKAVDEKLGM